MCNCEPAISTKLIAFFPHNSLCLQSRVQQSSGSVTWSCFKPAHTHVALINSATHTSSGREQPDDKSHAGKDAFYPRFYIWFLRGKRKKQKQAKISVRTSVQGSCWEEVPQWVWEPSWWLISTWWWVSGSHRGSLQVVSGLVLWLSGGEVVLQEGLDVLKSGPLVWLFLPAEPHHFV